MIYKVTVTGADDNTDVLKMVELQKKFPFVEFAILVQPNRSGLPRWPRKEWIKTLSGCDLQLSLHLCGHYVNDLLLGDSTSIFTELGDIWNMFDRVQINTHGEKHETELNSMAILLNNFPGKEFIFQYDNENNEAFEHALNSGVNCSALFDLSHGAGVLPNSWPKIIDGAKCGYAGGLSPDNVKEQMDNIIEKNGHDVNIWIDAETHLRSRTDGIDIFDLKKVESFLINSEEFVY